MCAAWFFGLVHVAESPYPLLGALIGTVILMNAVITMVWQFHIQGMALELCHFPRWFMVMQRANLPHLASKLTDAALEPAARRRAARSFALLRAWSSATSGPSLPDTRAGKSK